MAEVRETISGMSVEERLDIAAVIAHFNRAADSGYQAELDARMAEMDAGKKFTPADLERSHSDLTARGK